MTPQDFAASIKAKYPQYASMDDAALTQAIVAKYPQYASQISGGSVADQAKQHLATMASGGDVPQGALNPDQPSFLQGVRESLPSLDSLNTMAQAANPLIIPMQHPIDAITHPIDTLVKMGKAPVQPIMDMAQAQLARAGRAKDAFGRGDYVDAARQAVLAGTPIAGPIAGNIGDAIGEGNIAEGLGQFAGVAGQVAAPEIAGKAIGPIARAIAPEKAAQIEAYAKVLDPKGKNPEVAHEVAERLMNEGVVLKTPRTDLANIAEGKAAAVNTDEVITNRPQAARTGPILQELADERAKLFNEVKRFPEPSDPKLSQQLSNKLEKLYPMAEITKNNGELVVNQIRHPEMWDKANDLNKLARHIKDSANRGMISNETLRNLVQDYNYFADKSGAFGENASTNPVRMPANANAAHAIRDVVNEDPAAAAANKEKSLWLSAKNDLAPSAAVPKEYGAGAVARVVAKTAATAVAGVVGGPVVAKAVAGILGAGEIGKLARTVMTSPQWKTWSAIRKMQFAKAITSGDAVTAGQLAAHGEQAAAADNNVRLAPVGQIMQKMGVTQ